MNESHRMYRASTLGLTLGKALVSMIDENKLTKKEAAAILEEFDECIKSKVSEPTPASTVASVETATIEGDLDYFNCFDGTYYLQVNNAKVVGGAEIGAITVVAAEQRKRRKLR
jgi:hypothetical protein